MTTTCKVCGREIARRFVGQMIVWGHVVNPRDQHHEARPPRNVAPESEAEKREAYGR